MTEVATVERDSQGRDIRTLALAMFAAILVSYVVNAMDRQLFSVLATDVRKALHLSIPQIGLASTVFTLGMGLAGVPTAYLLQRTSRKTVMLLGILIFSAATVLTAFSTGLANLAVCRFASGLGEAMQLTAILAIGTTYFSNHRAMAASSLIFAYGIGAIIGPNLGAAILGGFQWQVPFVVLGLLGLPTALLIALCVRTWFSEAAPPVASLVSRVEIDEAPSIWSFQPMLLAVATAFVGFAIYGYLGLYPTFLREALGFTAKQAALAVSFYGLGAMLASLVGGWAGDRFNFRTILVVFLLVAAASGSLLFTDLHRSVVAHILVSMIFGMAISGVVYTNLSAGLVKSVTRKNAAHASGLFVASLYIPAAFAGYVIGAAKDVLGWAPAGALQLVGSTLVAAVLSLAIRPARAASAQP